MQSSFLMRANVCPSQPLPLAVFLNTLRNFSSKTTFGLDRGFGFFAACLALARSAQTVLSWLTCRPGS